MSRTLHFTLTGLMAMLLIGFSLAGCQKEEAAEPELYTDSYDDEITFRESSACDAGVKLLQMRLKASNRYVMLMNNGVTELTQTLPNPNGTFVNSDLIQFYSNVGTVNVEQSTLGVDNSENGQPERWINDGEKLYLKVGTAAEIAGWKFMAAGIWIEAQPNSTINIQMRKNGANVQPPFKKTYTGAANSREHVLLSFAYLFDEIEISALAGSVRIQMDDFGGLDAFNRFIITNNSNYHLSMRSRAGIYFWNSMVSKDHNRLDKPNHQYVVGGEFTQTANGDQWVTDITSIGTFPGYLNTQVTNPFGPVGPSTGPGADRAFNAGDILSLEIGPDVAAGMEFLNAVIPIRTSAGGGTPVIALLKGGTPIGAPITLTQAPNTTQYHLIGLSGQTFDQIILSCSAGSYWFFTDYWSVARFSMCDASPPAFQKAIAD